MKINFDDIDKEISESRILELRFDTLAARQFVGQKGMPQSDPFDFAITAQATSKHMTLITSDGNTGDYPDNYFNGAVDAVRVYNTPLTGSQAQSLYTNNAIPLPTLSPLTESVAAGQAVTTNVISGIANNPDSSSILITTPPSHGSASVNTSTGTVTYTSNSNYTGTDALQYQVCSAVDGTACASSTITYMVAQPAAATTTTQQLTNTGIGIDAVATLAALLLLMVGIVRLLPLRDTRNS